jgi:hypothetical protein
MEAAEGLSVSKHGSPGNSGAQLEYVRAVPSSRLDFADVNRFIPEPRR